jgi:hypothetical protein
VCSTGLFSVAPRYALHSSQDHHYSEFHAVVVALKLIFIHLSSQTYQVSLNDWPSISLKRGVVRHSQGGDGKNKIIGSYCRLQQFVMGIDQATIKPNFLMYFVQL